MNKDTAEKVLLDLAEELYGADSWQVKALKHPKEAGFLLEGEECDCPIDIHSIDLGFEGDRLHTRDCLYLSSLCIFRPHAAEMTRLMGELRAREEQEARARPTADITRTYSDITQTYSSLRRFLEEAAGQVLTRGEQELFDSRDPDTLLGQLQGHTITITHDEDDE